MKLFIAAIAIIAASTGAFISKAEAGQLTIGGTVAHLAPADTNNCNLGGFVYSENNDPVTLCTIKYPVSLPAGTTIEKIDWRWVDKVSPAYIQYRLRRIDLVQESTAPVFTESKTTVSNFIQSSTSTINKLMAASEVYILEIHLNSGTTFRGATITYK